MRKDIHHGSMIPDYNLSEDQKVKLSYMLKNGWEEIQTDLPDILSLAARDYAISTSQPRTINNTELREELSKISKSLSRSADYLSGLPQGCEEYIDEAFWLANNKDNLMKQKFYDLDYVTSYKYVSGFSYILDGMIKAVDHLKNETPSNGKKGDLDLFACIVEMILNIKKLPKNTDMLVFSSSEGSVFCNIIKLFLGDILNHPIKNPKALIDKSKRRVEERLKNKPV